MVSGKLTPPHLTDSVPLPLAHEGEPKLGNVNLAHRPEVISQDVDVWDHRSVCPGGVKKAACSVLDPD